MPLEILAVMVVAGIALVVAMVSLSGLSHPVRIDGPAHARDLLSRDCPDIAPRQAVLAADGRTALFDCGAGGVAMVMAFGSRFVTRRIAPTALKRVAREDERTVTLTFPDIAIPALRIVFDSAEDAERLVGWLGAEATAHA